MEWSAPVILLLIGLGILVYGYVTPKKHKQTKKRTYAIGAILLIIGALWGGLVPLDKVKTASVGGTPFTISQEEEQQGEEVQKNYVKK